MTVSWRRMQKRRGEDEEGVSRRLNFSIRSGALDEKVAALECLAFLFSTQGAALAPYIDRCCVVMDEVMDFMHGRVREAVTAAMFDLLQWYHKVYPIPAPIKGQVMQIPPDHVKVLHFLMPTQVQRLSEEDEREVVKALLELIEACIRLYGWAALKDCQKPLLKQLLVLLKEKAPCQRPTDDEGEDTAHDVVLDHTCEVITALALTGGAALYSPTFNTHAPLLLQFTQGHREPSTRGMAIGTLAELGQELGWEGLGQWVTRITEVAVKGMEDVSIEVRRNATFCVAILVTAGGAAMVPHWPAIIQAVEKLLQPPTPGMYGRIEGGSGGHRADSKEERKEERRVEHEERFSQEDYLGCRDNAASVLARLLTSASAMQGGAGVAFDRLMGLMLQVLPLTVDQQEAGAVYGGLMGLYRTVPQAMGAYTGRILQVLAGVMGHPEVDVAVQRDIVAFCKAMMEANREAVEQVVGGMGEGERERFIKFVVAGGEVEGKKETTPLATMIHQGPSSSHALTNGVNGHASTSR